MMRRSRVRFLGLMAWREMRGAWRHFFFFLACIAVGVGALIGVAGFSDTLDRAIRKEARTLMAGDIQVRTARPLSASGRAALEALQSRGIQMTTVSELVAMAANPRSGETLLVELKAVEAGYPFYGTLVVAPPEAARALTDGGRAIAEEGLLARLGLQPGDRVKLGRAELTIAGVITKEPDRVAGAFSLGPRLLIAQSALAATGLIQPGSRVRYRHLLKLPLTLPDGLSAGELVTELTTALAAEHARVSAYDDAQPRLRRFLENLTTYLGLVGLISLLIGGIGVANSVQAFMKQKMETIAMMKCLGADGRTLLSIYLLQTLLLAGLGSLAGVALGVGVQWALPPALSFLVPVAIDRSVALLPIVRGVAMGVLTALLFSLWPLLAIRQISPARLFRQEVSGEGFRSGGRRPWLTAVVIVTGLVLLALWQVGRIDLGATVVGVLAASLLALWATALTTMRVVRAFPRARSLAVRQGLANLHRPGSRAVAAVLSVGAGVTVILAIALVEANLLRQVDENLPTEAPSLFFIDIQRDQREPFAQLLAGRGLPVELTPIVRSRLAAVGDRQVAQMQLEGRSDAWYFQREYVVTMQQELPKGNRLVEGDWWGAPPAGDALISVEEEAARHLGVGLGSALTFDVQGHQITATVASLREVNWGSLSTNFFIIFSPGALDGLPLTYIATTRTVPSEDLPLQRAVVAVFPNVTAINIRHLLDAVGAILERIGLVVRVMALFTIVTGLLVLAGAIATTRYRRLREAVLFKTLGATRLAIARIFAVEYAVLGAAAGLIGVIMASVLSFILLKFFMHLPWQLEPGLLAAGLLAAALLTVLTGFLATARILGQKPLAVLRQE